MRFLPFKLAATVALTVFAATGAFAQFTTGNLVVSRIGDGSATLSNAATAVFLDQYTTATGQTMPVSSLALPTAVSGTNRRVTSSGSATSEGFLSRSQDGRYLTYAGYDAALGTTGVASTASTAVRLVAASINIATGTVDSSTSFGSTAYNTNNIRSAATVDGSSFFGAGGNTGISNAALGADASTVVSSTSTNNRVLNIFNNTLYFSTGSGANRGIYSLGSTASPNATATLLVNTGASSSPFDFAFNADGSVLYVADDAAGLTRYTLSSGTVTSTTLLTSTAVRGLSVDFSTANATVYATNAAGSSVVRIVDTGMNSTVTTLFTAGTNTVFRDVSFIAPLDTPEPGTLALLGVGAVPGIVLFAARRRRARKTA